MMTSVDRSLFWASSMSSLSSPDFSMKREITPPSSSVSDPALLHVHDRLNQLDSKVLDIRATVLTKDAYVDRRNFEDGFIRREFDKLSGQLDSVVGKTRTDIGQLKTDLSQLKTEIIQLRAHVEQLGSKESFLHSDVTQIQGAVNQLHIDVQQLHTDVCSTRTDLSQVQAIVSQIRIDLMTFHRETSQQFGSVESRLSAMESRMKHTERVRFNGLAHTIYAPINAVPRIEEGGSLTWPQYFPSTVWKFWCLKKRSRLHRLVELAEFYELEGYENWSRKPHSHDSMFPGDGYASDSSDSSDRPSDLTRSEAARQYPEACHQHLAATLGLVYSQIRNEVGEGPLAHTVHHVPKRSHDDIASVNSSVRHKSTKAARRSNNDAVSSGRFHKILAGVQTIDTKSTASEGFDRLGYDINASQMSDETMSKLKDIVAEEVNSRLLKAMERGNAKIQPSYMERARLSPTDMSVRTRLDGESPAADHVACANYEETATEPNTVPTEIISPVSAQSYKACGVDGAEDSST